MLYLHQVSGNLVKHFFPNLILLKDKEKDKHTKTEENDFSVTVLGIDSVFVKHLLLTRFKCKAGILISFSTQEGMFHSHKCYHKVKKDSNTTEVAVGGVVFHQQEPHYHNENNR